MVFSSLHIRGSVFWLLSSSWGSLVLTFTLSPACCMTISTCPLPSVWLPLKYIHQQLMTFSKCYEISFLVIWFNCYSGETRSLALHLHGKILYNIQKENVSIKARKVPTLGTCIFTKYYVNTVIAGISSYFTDSIFHNYKLWRVSNYSLLQIIITAKLMVLAVCQLHEALI